jgi:hypothetical protein
MLPISANSSIVAQKILISCMLCVLSLAILHNWKLKNMVIILYDLDIGFVVLLILEVV